MHVLFFPTPSFIPWPNIPGGLGDGALESGKMARLVVILPEFCKGALCKKELLNYSDLDVCGRGRLEAESVPQEIGSDIPACKRFYKSSERESACQMPLFCS